MTENTTRDLAKYSHLCIRAAARGEMKNGSSASPHGRGLRGLDRQGGRVNVRQVPPVRRPAAVWPMCDRCGVRSDTVSPRHQSRNLCTECQWRV